MLYLFPIAAIVFGIIGTGQPAMIAFVAGVTALVAALASWAGGAR